MDHYFYTNEIGTFMIIMLMYVNSMLIIGPNMVIIKNLKERLAKTFEMKNIGW